MKIKQQKQIKAFLAESFGNDRGGKLFEIFLHDFFLFQCICVEIALCFFNYNGIIPESMIK